MHQQLSERSVDLDPRETAEWLEALDQIVEEAGSDRVNFLLDKLMERARDNGVTVPIRTTTDYINTIPADEDVPYPGDRALERRLKSLTRGNGLPSEQVRHGYRRPHRDLFVAGHAARSRLQSFLSWQLRRPAGRSDLLPGPRLAWRVRPRLSRRPPERRSAE